MMRVFPGRPAVDLSIDRARRLGSLRFDSRDVSPLVRARDALPSGRVHVTQSNDDRALWSAHFATSALPDESHYVHACCRSSSGRAGARGPSGQSRRLARTFPVGGRDAVQARETPVSCRACGGNPPPDQSGTSCPSAAGHQSLTPKIRCNRGGARFDLSRRARARIELRCWMRSKGRASADRCEDLDGRSALRAEGT
jgi:hypothetical protein